MKKKEILCLCAAALLTYHIVAAPVSAADYSFLQRMEPLQYDWEFQSQLKEDKVIKNGKPDTRWFDPDDPHSEYEITTAEQLMGLAELVKTRNLQNGENVVYTFEGITINLMNDIELTKEWTPIGISSSYSFEGTFNGNGHTISGVNISATDNVQGFFGYLKGTVKNLNIEGTVEAKGDSVGGLVGAMAPGSVVSGCTVNVNVSGKDRIGGVVGQNYSGRIVDCHNLGNVQGNVKVGGVVGENWNGQVKRCSNAGRISSSGKGVGTYGTGGVVGRSVAKDAVITECFNTGEINSANECAGGVVGYANAAGSTIDSCYNTGLVSGPSSYGYIGGLVGSIGENGVILRNSYNIGNVKDGEYLGGVLGNFTSDFYAKLESYISNNYYLDSSAPLAVGREKGSSGQRSYADSASAQSSGNLKGTRFAASLGLAYRADTGGLHGINNGFPVFKWQEESVFSPDEMLKKMDIRYKKQFREFFEQHPFGSSHGEFIIEAATPYAMSEKAISIKKQMDRKEQEK